jgi:DNA mismatch repair protein MutL
LASSSPPRDWTAPVPPFRPFPDDSRGFGSPRPIAPSGQMPAADQAFPAGRDASGGTPAAVSPRALQIHNRYVITETEEGLVVIDQHALHERIIYEQLREKVLSGSLESQQLLVPEPVSLSPAEAARVLGSRQLLSQIGIEVQEFGGDTVLVSAYPAMLANQNPSEMLRGVVDILIDESRRVDARDILDELLHMISCKAAIKAGDQLSDAEISALLEHRQWCQDAHHCPHGRPTALVFSREELDKRFKRI